jgi:Family of unknown function (DUF5675)
MHLVLQRILKGPDGIFGGLNDEDDKQISVTLERAYMTGGQWTPKIPAGVYDCLRGHHALENGVLFETFEVKGVEGHTGLLFHPGNFDSDSKGCILLGETIKLMDHNTHIITDSRAAFQHFLYLQRGLDSFPIEIKG